MILKYHILYFIYTTDIGNGYVLQIIYHLRKNYVIPKITSKEISISHFSLHLP